MDISTAKIAVIGSGAIGCYYGGKLAATGHDVHFLMRSDLEAVRRNGLTLREKDGEIHLRKIQAYATVSEIGPCDVVLIGLKTTSNAALAELIPPLLGDGTVLLTLQNGLGNEEFLSERFGTERVLGGLCFVCLNRVDHGVIEHYGHGTLSIGEFGRPASARTRAMVAAFQRSGIEAREVEELITERWRKLVWNIPFNGLSIAAGGITVDEILADEQLHALTRELMAEVIDAAGAAGHIIPREFIDFQIQRTLPMGAYKPSSLIDYLAHRAVEVESIWGEPWRRAVGAGAQVSRLETLYALLKKLTARFG